MLISCEQCSTTYSLDDDLVTPRGLSVQCTLCGHVFMARPSGEEPPSLSNEFSSFHDGERAQPSLRSTQIFGISPSEEMLLASALSSPSSAARGFEYGYAAEKPSNAQTPQGGFAGILESEPHEVAYFDFGAGASEEEPLNSHFYASPVLPEKAPVESPLISPASLPSASQRIAVSFRNAPVPPPVQQQAQEAASAVPHLAEQTVESAQERFAADMPSLVDEVWQAEDKQAAQPEHSKQRSSADFPAYVSEEVQRVEEEQAAQLHRFHQSTEFLMPARKTRRLAIFLGLVVLVVVMAVIGVWLSPQ